LKFWIIVIPPLSRDWVFAVFVKAQTVVVEVVAVVVIAVVAVIAIVQFLF